MLSRKKKPVERRDPAKRQTIHRTLVHSMRDIERAVAEARDALDLRPDEELWFRGVSKSEYELLPSLIRALPVESRSHAKITRIENDLFFEYLAKAPHRRRGAINSLGRAFPDATFPCTHSTLGLD